MKLKYITYESIEGAPDRFVVFDTITNHSAMKFPSLKILGAGFMGFTPDGKAYCYGESVSMKIKSRGGLDSDIINSFTREY